MPLWKVLDKIACYLEYKVQFCIGCIFWFFFVKGFRVGGWGCLFPPPPLFSCLVGWFGVFWGVFFGFGVFFWCGFLVYIRLVQSPGLESR